MDILMDINAMARELERDEGRRLHPYRDSVGKLTIGVGRNLDDDGISDEEATHLLFNDIEKHLADLRRVFPWVDRLDDVRLRVLVNMTFNMGITRLQGFHLFLKAVEAGRYEAAATEMLQSKWVEQVGNRARRLAMMMFSGEAK